MKELVVFMVSAGPNVFKENIKDTYESISKNLGHSDFWWYIVVDKKEEKEFVLNLIPEKHLLKIVDSVGSWAQDFNLFFDKYLNEGQYLLIVQDDIVVDTPDFYIQSKKEIEKFENKIAWITYTNTQYYSVNAHNSIRGGLYKDRKSFQRCECHREDGVKEYPHGPVKVFGPFIHIMLIKSSIMKELGKCPDWTLYVMLIDEHWCLKALTKNYFNVWIPNIFYRHPNPSQVLKRRFNLRFEKEGHVGFRSEWGFDCPPTDEEINTLVAKYPSLSSVANKYSYEWDYLK